MSQPRISIARARARVRALAFAFAAGACCGLGCSFHPPEVTPDGGPDTPPDVMPARAVAGLVAYWKFDETSGMFAFDTRSALVPAPAKTPIPLEIALPVNVTRQGGGLRIDSPVRVGTNAAHHVNHDVLASGEVTLEAWVSPANTTQGAGTVSGNLPNYALVLSLSPSYAYHNAMIAQVGDRWQGRVLTAMTDANATPVIETEPGTIAGTDPVHLVLVASATDRVLYVNGAAHRLPPPTGVGPLNAPVPRPWFDYFPISIGQELASNEKRSWLGTIWLAAIYDRALTEAEVGDNLRAGHACPGC